MLFPIIVVVIPPFIFARKWNEQIKDSRDNEEDDNNWNRYHSGTKPIEEVTSAVEWKFHTLM